MRNKTGLMAFVLLALLFSVIAGTQQVSLGRANPWPGIKSKIIISSPQNATYNGNIITVNCYVGYNWEICSVFYSLDGQGMSSVTNQAVISREEANGGKSPSVTRTTLKCSVALSNLAEGWHEITFYLVAKGKFNLIFESYERGDIIESASTAFKIDNTPPEVSVLSPVNKTYDSPEVPMNFTVNEVVMLIKYSLDKGENVTITGNTNLTGLRNGEHNVRVYATDEAGNTGVSETIFFTIELPKPSPTTGPNSIPEPFLTVSVAAASVASVAVFGLGLLFYFKKRKR